jgi:hypothetical protein
MITSLGSPSPIRRSVDGVDVVIIVMMIIVSPVIAHGVADHGAAYAADDGADRTSHEGAADGAGHSARDRAVFVSRRKLTGRKQQGCNRKGKDGSGHD